MADDADRAQEHMERMEQIVAAKRKPRPITRVHDWCIGCGEKIEPERLMVKPDASRCIGCQEDHERYESQYGS